MKLLYIAVVGLILAYISQPLFEDIPHAKLWKAAFEDDVNMIQVLVAEEGEEYLQTRDEWNNTVLHWAAKGNSIKLIKYFLKETALKVTDKNAAGSTPLHWSVYRGSRELISLLLAHPTCNISAANEDGETALHWAVDWKSTHAVSMLLKAGADPNQLDRHDNNAMHKIDRGCDQNPDCRKIVRTLVRYSVNIQAKNEYGRAPLTHYDIHSDEDEMDEEEFEEAKEMRQELEAQLEKAKEEVEREKKEKEDKETGEDRRKAENDAKTAADIVVDVSEDVIELEGEELYGDVELGNEEALKEEAKEEERQGEGDDREEL